MARRGLVPARRRKIVSKRKGAAGATRSLGRNLQGKR
jgi:hypothetical protein